MARTTVYFIIAAWRVISLAIVARPGTLAKFQPPAAQGKCQGGVCRGNHLRHPAVVGPGCPHDFGNRQGNEEARTQIGQQVEHSRGFGPMSAASVSKATTDRG